MEERDRMLLDCLKKQDTAVKLDRIRSFTAKDWEVILAVAMRHGVVPILFHTLKPLFSEVDIPAPVREKMQRMYYLSAARNTRIYHELSIVLAALNAIGINVILLKGAHLADNVYGNIALRPMGDVDLLARQRDLLKIHHVLLDLGYGSDDGEISCKIHLAPYMKQNGLKIDVHFDIAKPPVS
ncbi:MAG: nucleotidyltransferase family protein, partial [Desulfotignum sp.]|nr:nucleotidyltransferase family protein [Desulfotignum sp.]